MAVGSIGETTFLGLTQILIKQNINQTGETKRKSCKERNGSDAIERTPSGHT